MSNFDERSGVIYCKTPWGQWAQTIDEIFIEVQVTGIIRAKDICCEIKPKFISVTIKNEVLFKVRQWRSDVKYARLIIFNRGIYLVL